MSKPKLLDQVRNAIRTKHYSIRTEEAYVRWIKQFIFFHNKRHPAEMGEQEVRQFLSHLAVNRQVVAAQPRVRGPVHVPHAACAEAPTDLIVIEFGADVHVTLPGYGQQG